MKKLICRTCGLPKYNYEFPPKRRSCKLCVLKEQASSRKRVANGDFYQGRYKTDLTGKKFGSLLVSRYYGNRCHLPYWECLCDCGNTTPPIRGCHLMRGLTTSCGCLKESMKGKQHPRWNGYEDMSGSFLLNCKHNAQLRNLEWNVNYEYLWKLYEDQNRKCAITGAPISFSDVKLSNDTTASLDRIDNAQGYVCGNVQWVHKVIQKMRMELSVSDFIDWCKKVAIAN